MGRGGFGLFLVGELYKAAMTTEEGQKLGTKAMIIHKMFPFPDKKYEFNLTHVMLFSLLIAVLSMLHHPAQDVIEHDAEKPAKKKKSEKKDSKEKKEAK